ncbi:MULTISPECIES: DUF6488 family protein [Leptospira]|uniref:PepSY domain-containing protein n=2 Tax=Leptospira TaxID=171 RepID=A0A2M9ZZE7_9LEPT|nr:MULTISPECIES: DUF6488 family protein [Leptospira]PJZ77417.1 hypothetical protein CH365_07455 [Leptospira neocaledonica]PKA16846.1 hypothetical protein CH363_05470 [Leptospira haakeii]PKA19263.1 hypothetical protein CH377_13130 [Leptospira haakeii]
MKNKFLNTALAFSIIGLLVGANVYAHGDHKHEEAGKLGKKEAISAAAKGVASIISKKEKIEGVELDATWNDKAVTSRAIKKEGSGYYIIRFTNQKLNKNLFILLSDDGEVFDANFSGVFKDLKE